MSKGNEPAFPNKGDGPRYDGLTKREYFAAMAMQGILVNPGSGSVSLIGIARDAVRQADALIAELEKEPTR